MCCVYDCVYLVCELGLYLYLIAIWLKKMLNMHSEGGKGLNAKKNYHSWI
jgi:hypothetical protein